MKKSEGKVGCSVLELRALKVLWFELLNAYCGIPINNNPKPSVSLLNIFGSLFIKPFINGAVLMKRRVHVTSNHRQVSSLSGLSARGNAAPGRHGT